MLSVCYKHFVGPGACPANHFSRKSFKTTKHQLATSCSYLSLLLRLPWHLRLTQLSQSSLTRLSLVPSSAKQGTNNNNDKSLIPVTKDVPSCGQQAETPQPTACHEANEHVSVQQTIGSFPSYRVKRLLVQQLRSSCDSSIDVDGHGNRLRRRGT